MSRHRSNKSFFAHHRASSNKLCSLLNPQFIHPNIGICRDLMVTETDSFEFIEYFLLYDPSSLHVLFGIRCETDKMRSVERNRDESPHSKVDHGGVFVADVCFRKY